MTRQTPGSWESTKPFISIDKRRESSTPDDQRHKWGFVRVGGDAQTDMPLVEHLGRNLRSKIR